MASKSTQPKTAANEASVAAFLATIDDMQLRRDAETIAGLMRKATKAPPRMWGNGIVGFGERQQVYADGREATWMQVAFAPRKGKITLYLDPVFTGRDELLKRLGRHSCGKSCVHIKTLADVDAAALKALINAAALSARTPPSKPSRR